MSMKYPDYLGDGVYVEFDGYHIWLHTQEGSRIALEPAVLMALEQYLIRLGKKLEEES